MTAWLKIGVGVAALALLAGPQSAFAADAAHPTVVELFQSQGCSSCPPAEANVGAISERSDVLALAFEVDYWDRLGWKDTFSRAAWTARQYAYARAMGRDGVYTPQVVVNGRVEGDGLEPGELSGLISRGDRGAGGPNVGFSGGAVTVGVGAAPAGGADVWLARYIPRTVEVAIPRGENAGHTLPYKDVVREMALIGHWHGEAATFPVPSGSDPTWRKRRSCRARAAADPGGGEGALERYPNGGRRPGFDVVKPAEWTDNNCHENRMASVSLMHRAYRRHPSRHHFHP